MLFSQKTVFVGGKGGVGKSVVSAALALVSSINEERTLLVQIGPGHGFQQIFCSEPLVPGRIQSLTPSISALKLDLHSVAYEFLERHLPIQYLATKIANSEFFQSWIEATPMLSEVLLIGKIWKLATSKSHGAENWDKMIVETPATGHGLALLGAANQANSILVGPMKSQATALVHWLKSSSDCAYTFVTLAEEMAVQETLEWHQTASEKLGIKVATIFLNGCCPEWSDSHPDKNWSDKNWPDKNWSDKNWSDKNWSDDAKLFVERAAALTSEQLRRSTECHGQLAKETGCQVMKVPYLPALNLTRRELEHLAKELVRGFAVGPQHG